MKLMFMDSMKVMSTSPVLSNIWLQPHLKPGKNKVIIGIKSLGIAKELWNYHNNIVIEADYMEKTRGQINKEIPYLEVEINPEYTDFEWSINDIYSKGDGTANFKETI